MPSKTVSEDVYRRILLAMSVIEQDTSLKRTKREIERLSGLSHDAVARAFRKDKQDEGRPWGLNDRYSTLTAGGASRRSVRDDEVRQLENEIAEKRRENRELRDTVDLYATALYAHYLQAQQQDTSTRPANDPIPIGRNRRNKR